MSIVGILVGILNKIDPFIIAPHYITQNRSPGSHYMWSSIYDVGIALTPIGIHHRVLLLCLWLKKKGKMMSINFYMIFSIFCRWGVWWWTWQDLYGNSCKTVSLKCAQINKTYKVLHFLYLNIEITKAVHLNTLRPRQNGFHFADDIFKRIFMHENIWVSLKISLNFVP